MTTGFVVFAVNAAASVVAGLTAGALVASGLWVAAQAEVPAKSAAAAGAKTSAALQRALEPLVIVIVLST
ncbi:MAG: hypothetical protein F2826_02520 [Actinobacteria bacterium]|nr:hypothetical protein [Actinomycetota bacterium]